MPLFNYKENTIMKIFILNALVSSTVIIIAMYVNDAFIKYYRKKNRKDPDISTPASLLVVFGASFISYMLGFLLLHYLLGYGDTSTGIL